MTISEELYKVRRIKNFNFLPNHLEFDDHFKKHFKEALSNALNSLLDFLPFGFFLLFSFFINENSLTANIILMNVFSLLHSFAQGLSSTLKNYILYSSIGNKHSHQAKIKYVKIFTNVVLILAGIFSIVLITLGGNVTVIYINNSYEIIAKEINDMHYFFTAIMFLDFVSEELEGYVRGINIPNNLIVYKIVFPIIFLPIGFALCFFFDYGIRGLWIGIFLNILVYTFPNGVNVYNHYDLFFQR